MIMMMTTTTTTTIIYYTSFVIDSLQCVSSRLCEQCVVFFFRSAHMSFGSEKSQFQVASGVNEVNGLMGEYTEGRLVFEASVFNT